MSISIANCCNSESTVTKYAYSVLPSASGSSLKGLEPFFILDIFKLDI